LQREQSVRTQKTLTLAEIGRRIALGDFKELNIILKGDVDGSVEALADSFQKLSTEEIQINILHKGVGAITESDVLLATASDAIIVGFNVRPQGNARTIADREEVDIRTYSIIYDAINDLKDAMEGMLSPEMREEISGNVEIREVYKISKVGNIAGCMVISGKIFRDSLIRIIRQGIVVHQGTLSSLKRFKDDVKEVAKGYDCGLQIKNYNDIEEGDLIESYKEVAVKKKL
jgi:translation initiation factor IF-2